jgi:hypothetical protein
MILQISTISERDRCAIRRARSDGLRFLTKRFLRKIVMAYATSASFVGSDSSERRWDRLYRTGAVAALVTVGLFLVQIAAFFLWPPPSTVAGHFAVLQSRPIVGLVSLDFLILVDEVLAIPLCFALYLSLRRGHEAVMLLATAFTAASIMCFLIATPALNMLYLSQKYAAATTGAEQEGLLAAGEAVLSSWMGTPYQVGYALGSIDMLLVGWVMLRSQIFSKAEGYVGIAAALVGFGVYVPKVGVLISIVSVVGMQVWYVMIAMTLFRLSKSARRTA